MDSLRTVKNTGDATHVKFPICDNEGNILAYMEKYQTLRSVTINPIYYDVFNGFRGACKSYNWKLNISC